MKNLINNIQKMKKCSLLGMLMLLPLADAEAKDVKGKVTDAATGLPLTGVQVKAYGNERFTAMTDTEGKYSISVPDHITSLYLSLDGLAPVQVAIGSDLNNVNARLYSNTFSNSYKKVTSGNRLSSATDFENHAENSIDPFIQQRLGSEVRSISRGGTEAVGNVMFINGLNSLQSNAQPLVVIDGVVMDMQYDRTMLHDGYYNNILANVNVNDIDKVEVLKNGTAIYGAKGANGVVLITTKRNRSMATKIDVTVAGKFQLMPRTASVLGAEDFRTYVTELLSARTTDMSSMKFLISDPSYYYYNEFHNETDWKDEVYENAFAQNYGINVQGGDDVANYNLSVGYSLANSTLKKHDFSRFDMRLNTDINIIKNLECRFDASFSDVSRKLRDIGISSDIESTTPTAPNFISLIKSPFLSPYAFDIYGNRSSYLAEEDNYLQGLVPTNDRSIANPLSILENGEGRNKNTFGNRLVMFSITPRYHFNKHLSLSEAFNFSLVNTNEEYYLPKTGVPSFLLPGVSDRIYVDNIRQSLAARQNFVQSDTRITWDNHYGAHYIKAFGGVRYINNSYKLNVQKGYNTPNDKNPDMSTSLSYKTTEGADDKTTDITWYASADYNYAEKYYLSAALSAQASSRFGKDADGLKAFGTVWGIFPSIQGSYVLSNEKWLADVKGIDYLRLNLGYDVSGNDNLDYTASRTYFIAQSILGADITGKFLGNVGNSTLKWETTRRLTAGFEGNFLKNRLHAAFNFYKSWTSDLVGLNKMSWTSGVDQNWGNDGKLENMGFDVNVAYRLVNTKNFHWELGASAGHYENKVTALSNNNASFETNLYGATVLTAVGNPVGVFYGYATDGVFSTTKEAADAALYQEDNKGAKVYFQAGDMKFVDQNGDHRIDDRDRVIIGNPNPDIYGNIFTHLNWKNWSLDATFTYCLGNDIFNYERSILESGKYFYNQTTAMNGRWTTEGQETSIPRVSYMDAHGNSRFSDRWIEDGSYLRLSNLTLSYSLPMNTTFLQGITVWGAAYNLFTVTRYLGSNPDCALSGSVLSQGIDRGLLGAGRTFAMGLKINL